MSVAASLVPSCQDVTAVLTDFLEGQLSWRRRLGVRLHLGLCPSCRRFLDSLQSMPGLLKRILEQGTSPAPESARLALDSALARLGQPRNRRSGSAPGGPEVFAAGLAEGRAGLTLRLMAETQNRLLAAGPLAAAPYLPAEVLQQLPPERDWHWLRPGGTRIARLCRDQEAQLFLLRIQPRRRFPKHLHLGRETLLVLQGGLEDGDRHLGSGDWSVHEGGSVHAPSADGQGCWALARLEGEVAFSGWLGLLQRWSG